MMQNEHTERTEDIDMAKKTFLFFIIFSSLLSIEGQNVIISARKQDSLLIADDIQRKSAIETPIIMNIYLQNSSYDYLEQHYYPNGQLYYQVPIVNGKRNGICTEYYSNGQFHYEYLMKDGKVLHNNIVKDDICYNYYGIADGYILYKKKGRKLYKCVLQIPTDKDKDFRYYLLNIYQSKDQDWLVTEFRYINGMWEKSHQHIKPNRKSQTLLRMFLREWEQKGYNNLLVL